LARSYSTDDLNAKQNRDSARDTVRLHENSAR
jgi:hypothetical protein